MLTCDVAIVGAGLAGMQCARLLATRGLRVILLDRKASVAAPVHTTGIFVRKTWEDFPLPAEQLGRPIRDVLLYSPAGSSLHLTTDHDEFRVGRMQWIHLYFLEQCARAGVRWLPSTRVIGYQSGRLIVRRGRGSEAILARYIVGADGARSLTAQHLGLDRNSEFLVGLEEIVQSPPRSAALHCFLDPSLAPGYIAWVVEAGGEAHVGVAGYRSDFDPARALSAFRERVRHLAPGEVIERRGGLIPVNGVLRRIANRNGLLVGDAAGAVSPLTAGGLDGALRLSTFAAEVIAAYLDHGDPAVLQAYDGARLRTRFVARRWMRRLWRTASRRWAVEMGFALLHLPPLRALAAHIFFSRGSFPDVAGDHFVYVRDHSTNAG